MRIGMILDKQFPPDPRVENEALSLLAHGNDVFLFCLDYSNSETSELYKGIQIRRYKSTTLLYKLSALTFTFPFYRWFMKGKIVHFIRENAIEVLHIHDIQIAGAVFRANTVKGLDTVLDLHENRPEIMKLYPHLQRFPGKFLINPKTWKEKEESFVKKASKVIVVTEESKVELISRTGLPGSKVIVVPNTVSKDYGKDVKIDVDIVQRFKANFSVVYIGDTGLRRGLLTAIDSIPGLVKQIPELKLIIVGSSQTDVVLKERAKALDVENYISFEGWQNEDRLVSYIKASDVCISPLHANKHHHTTYANKLFQYMCLEKALLVSDVLAQKNIIIRAKAGLVHEAENVDDFVEKLMLLYKQSEKRQQYGANGRAFVEKEFHWEKTSQKLIDLYSN